jgi:hypothetical protein
MIEDQIGVPGVTRARVKRKDGANRTTLPQIAEWLTATLSSNSIA